jgi:hypothetical protein
VHPLVVCHFPLLLPTSRAREGGCSA